MLNNRGVTFLMLPIILKNKTGYTMRSRPVVLYE